MIVTSKINTYLTLSYTTESRFMYAKVGKCVGVRKENSRPCDVLVYGRFTIKLKL